MNIGFLPFMPDHLFYLLFYHRTQSLRIDYLLASNTLIHTLPSRNQACEVSDLGIDHLLIIRRLIAIDEPFDHLIFHHRRKHLDR